MTSGAVLVEYELPPIRIDGVNLLRCRVGRMRLRLVVHLAYRGGCCKCKTAQYRSSHMLHTFSFLGMRTWPNRSDSSALQSSYEFVGARRNPLNDLPSRHVLRLSAPLPWRVTKASEVCQQIVTGGGMRRGPASVPPRQSSRKPTSLLF